MMLGWGTVGGPSQLADLAHDPTPCGLRHTYLTPCAGLRRDGNWAWGGVGFGKYLWWRGLGRL